MSEHVGLHELERAAALVHTVMPATPQYCWPLLAERAGCELWVKHENQTPAGAFKIRGGIVYMDQLRRTDPTVKGVIAATRGNHGQSVAFAATRAGLTSTVVVPEGNSVEKNAAMRAWGAELIVHGHDFQESFEYTKQLAEEKKLHMVDSFDPILVAGVGTYGLELFRAVPDLAAVFVPIGLGSGICGVMAARDAVGSKAEVWGVVAENAPAYALSFEAGELISTNSADTMADGVACRVPIDRALQPILAGAAGIIRVSEAEIKAAMRHYYTDTHNLAEGAGAAPLAALLQQRASWAGRKVGVILTGGNVDMPVYQAALTEAALNEKDAA
ncbi:MAG: threonine dehydratase [Alphaproteobacteria bacterium]|nr:threonine dehydratase [Alphaproteobacteria bacterium]